MPATASLSIQPSTAYIAIARSLSARIPTSHPHPYRKLLVLDLNGTLLHRSKSRKARGRPIYPRPYMPSFRSYLFHESVKSWLDVMVWSSAQPENVHKMVTRCFETHKDELKATWTRDMLGLAEDDYFQKVQTVKDLQKCWSNIVPDSPPSYSAETTLLIDDSAKKAVLQPYNHICVLEYNGHMRTRDLNTFECLKKEARRQGRKRERERDAVHTKFDSTLIAVMGVLDEIREQSNVAGWIRAGGLWGGHGPPSTRNSPDELFSDGEKDDRQSERGVSSNPGDESKNDSAENGLMWFEHEPCFRYWVDRGTRAVRALGIELDYGVTN